MTVDIIYENLLATSDYYHTILLPRLHTLVTFYLTD